MKKYKTPFDDIKDVYYKAYKSYKGEEQDKLSYALLTIEEKFLKLVSSYQLCLDVIKRELIRYENEYKEKQWELKGIDDEDEQWNIGDVDYEDEGLFFHQLERDKNTGYIISYVNQAKRILKNLKDLEKEYIKNNVN